MIKAVLIIVLIFLLWFYLPAIFNYYLRFFWSFINPVAGFIAALKELLKSNAQMSFSQRWIFIPAFLAVYLFVAAQVILLVWVFVLTLITWLSLEVALGLAISLFITPLAILIAPFIAWHQKGDFQYLGLLLLITISWFLFSRLAFFTKLGTKSESESQELLGYSPHLFLLGALSFQVIALVFYNLALYGLKYKPLLGSIPFYAGVGLSFLGGLIFLALAIIAAVIWFLRKKQFSLEEKSRLYQPPIWFYLLGLLCLAAFICLKMPIEILWLLFLYFVIALIVRLISLIALKRKG